MCPENPVALHPGKQLRILGLSTSYPLREGMAAGVFVQKLYAHLPAGCSVEVLSPDDDGAETSQKRASGSLQILRVRYAPRRWQKLGQRNGGILPALRTNRMLLLLLPVQLAALAWATFRRSMGVDVIHANWSICGAVGALVAALGNVRLVTTLRGEDTGPASGSLWVRVLLAICVSRSDAIVCVSNAMAKVLTDRYPSHAHKINVIHNGVDHGLHMIERPVPVQDCLRLLVVGSIVHRKGIDVLMQALATTKAACRVELTVAGDGPDRTTLQSLVEALPPSHTVAWLGEVPPDQVPRLLSKNDVLVLSSRSEGRPNVVLEALAAGMPVISTNLPGVAGLVMDGVTGWLVEAGDSIAMARAIEDACDVTKRVSFGEEARRQSKIRGESWEAAGAAYAKLFESVLTRRGENR